MGVLYATFGDKQNLFIKAQRRYDEMHSAAEWRNCAY